MEKSFNNPLAILTIQVKRQVNTNHEHPNLGLQ